jgi:hypothetical protein
VIGRRKKRARTPEATGAKATFSKVVPHFDGKVLNRNAGGRDQHNGGSGSASSLDADYMSELYRKLRDSDGASG